MNATHKKTLYHIILEALGREVMQISMLRIMDLQWKRLVIDPKYSIDIVSFSRELGEMVNDCLDKSDRWKRIVYQLDIFISSIRFIC